jgi:hypothetical protein
MKLGGPKFVSCMSKFAAKFARHRIWSPKISAFVINPRGFFTKKGSYLPTRIAVRPIIINKPRPFFKIK